jgi:predicted acetyltransferase
MRQAQDSVRSYMLPALEVTIASADRRLPIYRMLELYQHDLSDIWDQDLDLHGEYGYALDRFWERPNCWPYVFRVDGKYAGFALVDDRVRVPGDDFWMDQFFVLKKYRRQGIGSSAATAVLDAHRGRWQVGEMPDNHAAVAFWRKVIGSYTAGAYTEERLTSGWWQGYVQRFSSAGHIDA